MKANRVFSSFRESGWNRIPHECLRAPHAPPTTDAPPRPLSARNRAPLPHGRKWLGYARTQRFVGNVGELFAARSRPDRHRHHHSRGGMPPRRPHGGFHRRTGGQSVIDQNHGSPAEVDERLTPPIFPLAAFQFGLLFTRHGFDRARWDPIPAHHVVVQITRTPPDAIAPMASSGCPGRPSFRTRKGHGTNSCGCAGGPPHRLGRARHLRPAGRRHQRHHGSAAHAAGPDHLRAGPPRRIGGVHGVRLREIHRPARRLPGDVRPRRDSSAERPVRREAGRRAGARHHRPDLSRSHRHAVSAGSRSAVALQGRRRLQPAGPGRRPRPRARRRRLPRRAVAARRRAHHDSRSISRSRRSATTRSRPKRSKDTRRRLAAADRRAVRRRGARRGRRAERRQEDRHPRRPGRARRRRPSSSSSPT